MSRSSESRDNVALLFRDNFTITTWLAIGALLQSIVFLAVGRTAFVPAAFVLLCRVADAYAVKTGLKHNHYLDGVIQEHYSAQLPGETDGDMETPADSDICVFIIGSKVNHPFGLLAPGYKELGQQFTSMVQEIKDEAERHGFLGSRSLVGAESATNNETVTIMYFKSSESVQAYATWPLHRKSLTWWAKHAAQYPHVGIFHELYQVRKKNYETVYAHVKPMLAGATQHKVESMLPDKTGEETIWRTSLVYSKGVLRTSLGRMGRLPGSFDRSKLEVNDDEKVEVLTV
ncbi:hypothetical protein AUEXF2481DRAFT_7329 [Aureobasidium subglaciale EXF-2481]|uniref:Uncharacterized protein n=1 Tax=Aureobasidium subglaciale (strain EXF-2481) TaxID=1043005 RepID=A0A074Y5G1_AURSE|nr:uncharacterized protein AUEXF2481DRAFT_7329 [Aureobasidium subglaciale EXF-2481]KAI5196651.1 hypothetical protein E4T38_08402 [Aureobasidium subglaciale]KAI5215517.1 hypothetical protein E4T40_08352 [Aureobasidium subglaciale]KAI5218641.1 hypothetical protein E4T41_08274 [Aureobasidium subglaciale]KAI5256185.1 hypothetical protein E4T46_08309 [Aureobasidium subglaciale]KEQ92970.1 hypothetical protein AUEXF2481DRAFT_7329 [Aureobasidium subglaciale EXF-2481]